MANKKVGLITDPGRGQGLDANVAMSKLSPSEHSL